VAAAVRAKDVDEQLRGTVEHGWGLYEAGAAFT
jgi:hypothetical protein